MKFRLWTLFASHPRLTLFLVGWVFGLVTGFGLAKGIIEIKLDKLWKSPTPAPSQSSPTPKPAPKPPPVEQLQSEPTLKSAKGFQKPNLYLGCQNVTLIQTIKENHIQQINLSHCRPGLLTIRCTSRNNPCGIAVRIGTFGGESNSSRPGTVKVTIRSVLDIDVRLAIIASSRDVYTIKIEFSSDT